MHTFAPMGVICVAGGGGGRGTSLEPGGACGSAGQPEPENPWIAGHRSALRPPPRARAPPAALLAPSPLSLSRRRRCLPGPRGRAGRHGGARRSASGDGRGPGSQPLPRLASRSWRRRLLSRCHREGTGGGRRSSPLSPHAPARRHPVLPRHPPTVGVGQRRGERETEGGEEPSRRVGSQAAGKETFPSRPPRVVPSSRLPQRLGTAPEAGARGQGRALGNRGEGCWVTCIGVPFALGLLTARGQGGRAAIGTPSPCFPQAGVWMLCCLLPLVRVWPEKGAAAPRAPPEAAPSTHTRPHTLTRSVAGAVTGHPRPGEGARRACCGETGAGSSRRTSRLTEPPSSPPGGQQPRERGPLEPRPPLLGAGRHPRPPLRYLAPPPCLLLRGNNTTALLLYPPSVGRLPDYLPLHPYCQSANIGVAAGGGGSRSVAAPTHPPPRAPASPPCPRKGECSDSHFALTAVGGGPGIARRPWARHGLRRERGFANRGGLRAGD